MTSKSLASRLHHIAVEVSNMDRSIEFYRELLGMKVSERHAANEVPTIPVELTFLRLHGNHHDLVLTHNPEKDYRAYTSEDAHAGPPGFHHFAFEFSSRAAWLSQLQWTRELNIEIVRGPVVHSPEAEGSWGENESFYVLDPDGHRIEFFCNLGKVDEQGWIRNAEGKSIGQRVDEL